MSLYRRTKLGIDLLQKLASKTITNNTTGKDAAHGFKQCSALVSNLSADASRQFKQYNSSSNLLTRKTTPITSSAYSVRSLLTASLRNINCLHRYGGGLRCYHVGRNQALHFRKPRVGRQWFQNKGLRKIALAVGSGVFIGVYYLNRETVPYTNRTRLVLFPRKWEKALGEMVYEDEKKTWEVLPVKHPLSVGVASISKEIIEVANKHVNGVDWNWEVLVVDDPQVNAACYPAGKIVVYTGLLKQFTTRGEVATIISHEIGHAIARHTAETLTKSMISAIFQSLIFSIVCVNDKIIYYASDILIHLPFSRKMEREADYLGLLMMASAGYDPQIAPKVYEKLALLDDDSSSESSSLLDKLSTFLSTHPPSMERAKLLTQAHVMGEALAIYKQARIKKSKKPPAIMGWFRAYVRPHTEIVRCLLGRTNVLTAYVRPDQNMFAA
ncbi:hypothetical protein AQUCO_01100410v1 [Aquilegia coerulea]|uniref:Peptidase M48 domain-containing protein n=1 Tax=Aquilegia coerulea TaxID=218851 RepID=A0A2G5E703_AQUCA|nr:hypothetical protein AQUCO_01100410v1 [Aquilegia coerulea]